MSSCSKVEEETNEEENSPREMGKTWVALEAKLICLNCDQIFSLPNETQQHMVITLKHLELYADKVKGAEEMRHSQRYD